MEVKKVIEILRSRWRSVGLGGTVGLLAFSTYALLTPKWYQAELAVVPGAPMKSPNPVASALSMDLPVDLTLGSSDAERIQAVIKSRSVSDEVIDKFHLTERYHQKFIEATRGALWTHCSTKIDKKPSVVSVACEDTDPNVAQQMTAYFGVAANKILRHISTSSAAEERRFLEQRVAESKREVDASAEHVREFEEQHRIVDLPEQSKAVVSAIASIKSDLLSKQLELDYLNGFSSSDESTAVQLRRQVGVMQSKMQSLEDPMADAADANHAASTIADQKPRTSASKKKAPQDIFPIAMTVPRLRFELGQLYREQKIQETLFFMLTERYEMARVNEARDTSVFQVLDEPVVPTHQSRPKRAQLMLVGLLLGLLAGAAFALRHALLASSLTVEEASSRS